MFDFSRVMEDDPMMRDLWRVLVQVASLVVFVVASGAPVLSAAQDPEAPSQSAVTERPTEGGDLEETPEVTEVDRILRIRRVIELDGQRLSQLREDLERREDILNRLAVRLEEMEADRAEWIAELEELDPADDPGQRVAFEESIEKIEIDLDLFKTQADLAYSSTETYRDSIEAMQKKLEREQRALDRLTGQVTEPGEPVPGSVEAPAGAVAQPPGVTFIPGMPPMTGSPVSAAPPASQAGKPETTEQIAARREVERRLKVVEEAELELVEFVKRKESLELQIGFEQSLIETAEGSRTNLERALVVYQADLEETRAREAKASELRDIAGRVLEVEQFLEAADLEVEERTAYRASLGERLESLALEETTLSRAVAEARDEAEEAARASLWLESPIHPTNVLSWLRRRGPRMLMVLFAAISLLVLIRLSVRRIARLAVRRGGGRRRSLATNRADTLAFSFKSAASMLIVIGGVLLILQEAGMDIKTVLGGAAIFGVAIAFGAQNLMRDYFTGFMILLEDQYELGDLVTIDSITGRVEKVNMRTTVLRDLEGRVHFIPNGNVRSVTNRTYEWGRAVLEVPVGYKEDVDEVMGYLLEVAEEFRADPEYEGWVTNEPVMLGVDKFTEYGVVIKFMAETRPDKIFPARRELLRRVKKKFDAKGIEISVPHRILMRPPEDGAERGS